MLIHMMKIKSIGVNKLKKRKVHLLIAASILLISMSLLLFTKAPKAVIEICSPLFQSGSIETQSLQYKLMDKGGLYDQVGQRLKEKGYEHHILGGITSKDIILVKFVLANKAVNDKRQEEIKEIFHHYVTVNQLDPEAFLVKVSNDTSTNW
ncbi:hypothetical protein [Psychrobacillus vulpis]|uniref:Uncharacterized protein n=1 Tax=Psychrobacillus vulpis TaxID=2325572 RepID=A0A544TPV3_9BACI|nr:hypothetical protein [Psychrobacillus vulpis]TQR19484.1 hypothetical protein FG384_12640 [Psychrobacillus vulpis]